jgi:hypothetical protein
MKFNKWTMGLAAVGVVSLTSVAQAEEKMNAVSTALSGTTISGYVDTSMQWNLGTGTSTPANPVAYPPYAFGGASKADGFNLNVVQLTIAKALDESEWAAGYRADLWFGPDAVTLGSQYSGSGDMAIRQAYVALRTPVGNGIDWKVGVFDTVVGYETLESGNNPNYTRSYGFSIEPTTHTGVLGTYRVSDSIAASLGVANTFGPVVNGRSNPPQAESNKTVLGSLALTAPSDWGWIAGSSFYFGIVSGINTSGGTPNGTTPNVPTVPVYGPTALSGSETHYYSGLAMATPVTGLKVGACMDYAAAQNTAANSGNNVWVAGLYTSYQATEKLSLHGRGEYYTVDGPVLAGATLPATTSDYNGYELTLTAQYDLWENVISRAEIRWDHSETPLYGQLSDPQKNAVMIAANIIYKF